jgi:ABC-type Mn2+/Zn2+ transport system permease subunit
MRGMFTVAPVIAVTASAIAFILANHYDYPPGQVTVALLGAALAALWVARWLGQRTARQPQP